MPIAASSATPAACSARAWGHGRQRRAARRAAMLQDYGCALGASLTPDKLPLTSP